MSHSTHIKHLIQPKIADLGEFDVRRLLPSAKQRRVGPWIFFDHFGPVTFPAGPGIAVRPHPHIGLATVSYLFEGEILHRDSLGYEQAIRPGDINLMVAGSGIVHSEREREEAMTEARQMQGLQLWLALPEADEETAPEFLHYPSSDIPTLTINDVPIRVMIGRAYGVTSPVKTFAETLYAEAELQGGQDIIAPSGAEELAVYVVEGALSLEGVAIPAHSLAILDAQEVVTLRASEASRIVFIGGEKVSHRYIWWNFVSSRRARIEQAKQDWAEGRFAKVAGDENEFIPLPEK